MFNFLEVFLKALYLLDHKPLHADGHIFLHLEWSQKHYLWEDLIVLIVHLY